ncbi:acyltransferase family protein [Hyphococcus sp. DH-69]|uniref:acyltransferase family protein n=1 Tax=Hyphococcus formosus TaxID=3143534 RepID=UPI00398AA8F1
MAVSDSVTGAFATIDRRRYDLDWLRAIAFGLLIFYHIGMFYVSWDWHVKSVYAGLAAEPLMRIVNPWRLALLFYISGVAVRFSTDKLPSRSQFASSRLLRLGLPILAGMAFFVSPQAYFELRQAQLIEPGYFPFYLNYLDFNQLYPIITPTWNHLWYIVYLLVYILLITPFLPMLRSLAEGHVAKALNWIAGGPVRLILFVPIPFIIYELWLSPQFPTTHNLVYDWANHAHRFSIFLLGYFTAKHIRFWDSVDRTLPLAAGIIIGVLALPLVNIPGLADIPFLGAVVGVLYAWSFIVLLMAMAQRYLNRPSAALRYVTGAVFCFYILHQTIIIIVGYYLTQLNLGVWPEFLVLTVSTIAGCIAGYETARRIPFVRIMFGIKTNSGKAQSPCKTSNALLG